MISICLSCFLSPVAEQFVFSPEHSYNFLFLISLSLLLHPACFPHLFLLLIPFDFSLLPTVRAHLPLLLSTLALLLSLPPFNFSNCLLPQFCIPFFFPFTSASLPLFSLYCPVFLSLSLFALFVRSSLTFQCMSSPKPALGGQR